MEKPKDVFVFHRRDARDVCLESLRRQSGTSRATRAAIVNDPGIRQEVLKHVGDPSEVLAATMARNTTGVIDRSVRAPMRFFVLTMKVVLEFGLALNKWQVPDESTVCFDDTDDFKPPDLVKRKDKRKVIAATSQVGNGAGDAGAESVVPPGPSEGERLRQHMERLGDIQRRQAQASDRPPSQVLTLLKKYELPPTMVSFETGAEADLSLNFKGSSVTIRFYDDSGREFWRRALAYYLTRSNTAWERKLPSSA